MGKTEPGNADREWLEGIYQKLLVKMKAECGRVGTKIPYSPKDGRYSDMAEAFPGGIGFWTNGFIWCVSGMGNRGRFTDTTLLFLISILRRRSSLDSVWSWSGEKS